MSLTVEFLKQKLREARIPDELHARFVEFQQRHAGKRSAFGKNPIVWGILFDSVEDPRSSAITPKQIEAFEEDGVWQVVCADVHMSDTVTIDQLGRLYWSFKPWYSDFDMYFANREPDLWKKGN